MMKLIRNTVIASLFGIVSLNALADTTTVLSVGSLPTSVYYGNNLASASSGTTFFDDYVFTIPNGSVNSITTSLNLNSILGLSDLRARIYSGSTHQTGTLAAGTIIEGWGTTLNYSPTASLTSVFLNPADTLVAGTYTLQIKGLVSGAAGGSYSGVLNVTTPVPEPESYALLMGGLMLIGFASRRRNKQN
ncbi:FxDxF family PEP-CTERM protein [Methylotenera sp.]|uniref:FxDxF family PEP-CTERM protein n=1 Tax=Methylotenera sp. TaxID=2051956 RepID=UPI00248A0C2A|nr:FxDxF family PEP-CTERM protein [Methylotenera sp.]MDI1298016.1 FxDxF family PEP-CTERM protein [Methylotenera sp.]